MSKSDRMYKSSPSIERDEESGKPKVKKKDEKPTDVEGEEGAGLAGETGDTTENSGHDALPVHMQHIAERREVKHKHVTEHLAMHHRHEMEHEVHGEGDKKALFKKHEAEQEDMHGRHIDEVKSMHKRQGKE